MKAVVFGLVILLAGCSAPKPLYVVAPPAEAERVAVRVGSIEVLDMSLPSYAAASEIVTEMPDGSLLSVPKALWADDPVRGMTFALAQRLDLRTTATAAAEPWPLTEPADIRVEVRVDRLIARIDATLELSGQYAVASPDGILREFVDRFEIHVPLAGEDPASIAAAQGLALDALAAKIIGRLAR